MSEIVSLSLSSEDEMVSHLCKFLRLGDIAPGKVCNASGMCLESVSRMSALVQHPAFASWQRRVAHEFRFREIAHACMPCGSGHDNSAFDATAVSTEVGVRAMLEMFTESGAVSGGGSTPFVQWIDSIAFSFCVRTRLPAWRVSESIISRMKGLDGRVRVVSISGSACDEYKIRCEMASLWVLPCHVIALSNVSDDVISVVPRHDGKRSLCVDRIELTVLAASSAIDLIRKCKFRGVRVRKWRSERRTGRDWRAARALLRLSVGIA